MRAIFISKLYNPGKGNRAHSIPLHAGLVAAAVSAGHDAVILAPKEFVSERRGHVVPALSDRKDPTRVAAEVHSYIRSEVGDRDAVVFHYEGDTATVNAFAAVAQDLPDVTFVVNLFEPELNFVIPNAPDRPWTHRLLPQRRKPRHGHESLARQFPGNMVIVADSNRRELIARSLGLPVAGIWPLHSQLSDPADEEVAPRVANPRPKVLVPVSARISDSRLIREIRTVIRSCVEAGADIDWCVSGALASKPKKAKDASQTLGRLAEVRTQAFETEDYAAQFLQSDVVWMPSRYLYDAQSSGKALDALASGCVLLSPSMSYGYREQSRWIPGIPTYSSIDEAADLFIRLPSFLAESRREMDRLRPEIRHAYSATSAFSQLMRFALPEGDGGLL